MKHELTFAARLMPVPLAARYLGVSETTLRNLPIPRKVLGGKRLYDRLDLDAFADDLRLENEQNSSGGGTCADADAVWGTC